MEKLDFKKQFKYLYNASAKNAEFVEVPQMNFLMVDGEGNPNTAKSFGDAIEALYPVAYTLKFMVKKGATAMDYGVLPLEGLWWADDMSSFTSGNKDVWKWTLMIMQPEFITSAMVAEAIQEVAKKKKPASLPLVRFETFKEGKAAQIMHIGSYADEGPTVQKLHDFIIENGCELTGKHHEIYLGDPRKSAPERLKTIVRQPLVSG